MLVNTEYFREPAIHFERYGRYADGDYETQEWYDYWAREHYRCIYGHTVGGQPITGLHYMYLNYLPIKRLVNIQDEEPGVFKMRRTATRGEAFPSFWDEDGILFHTWDIARNGITIPELDNLERFYGSIPLVRDDDNLQGGKNHLWLKPRGVGAPQPYNEIVITPYGERKIGDLKIGDFVMARDGTSTKVSQIDEQGNLPVYEMELTDGRKVTCGLNHTWTVYTYSGREQELTTKELLNSKLKRPNNQCIYYLPNIDPVQFENKHDFVIHPFLLGAIIGTKQKEDGGITLSFNSEDERDYACKILDNDLIKYQLSQKQTPRKLLYKIYISGVNAYSKELKRLGLNTSNELRKIPESYIYTSVQNRKELIKGIIATRLISQTNNYITVSHSSLAISSQIRKILWGLGHNNTIREQDWLTNRYWISFSTTDMYFVDKNKIMKKIDQQTRGRGKRVGIKSITKLSHNAPMRCIGVEHKEHLYLTRNYIATHNSWKGAAVPIHRQWMLDNTTTFLIADNKQYLIKDGIMSKYLHYINRLNTYGDGKNTNMVSGMSRDFLMTDNKEMTYQVGYKSIDHKGRTIKQGRLNTVYGVALDGNADKIRGKRGTIVFEEFGSFRQVANAWQIARESIEEDGNVYDMMLGFGTGGDESADIEDLTKMHTNPDTYNILKFRNEWSIKFQEQICAAFTPAYKSLSFIDKDGNSDLIKGKEFFDKKRELLALDPDSRQLEKHKAEKPYEPAEALNQSFGNRFPSDLINEHLTNIRVKKLFRRFVTTGKLIRLGNDRVKFVPDPTLQPYIEYPVKQGGDKTGAVCVMFQPYRDKYGKVPDNLYRISVDPYRQDSSTGDSVGAIYVFENPNRLTPYKGNNRIVAWYVGRPKTQEEFNDNLFSLAMMYNAKIAPENDEPGDIVGYAKRHKLKRWLEVEFELAYDTNISTKKPTGRPGMHIASGQNNLRKLQGDQYIEEWLLTVIGYDEHDNPIYILHTIYDEGLLVELGKYKSDGNFDRISAIRIGCYHEKEFEYKNRKVSNESRNFGKFFSKKLFS